MEMCQGFETLNWKNTILYLLDTFTDFKKLVSNLNYFSPKIFKIVQQNDDVIKEDHVQEHEEEKKKKLSYLQKQ